MEFIADIKSTREVQCVPMISKQLSLMKELAEEVCFDVSKQLILMLVMQQRCVPTF